MRFEVFLRSHAGQHRSPFVKWHNFKIFHVPPHSRDEVFVGVSPYREYYGVSCLLYVPFSSVYAYLSCFHKALPDDVGRVTKSARMENLFISLAGPIGASWEGLTSHTFD